MKLTGQRQAQQRVDRIAAFRSELTELEREGGLILTPGQKSALEAHLQTVLNTLARQFGAASDESSRRISWGMRLAAFLGGLAFCAAAVLFLHRIWGTLPWNAYAPLLMGIPLVLLAATDISHRRGADLYYTALLAWAAWAAPSGGTLELSEHELGLPPLLGESTVLFLDLRMAASRFAPEEGALQWLNGAKLAELGFDCHVPVTSPTARAHYRSLTARVVYIVLKRASETNSPPRDRNHSQLVAVGAGLALRPLQERFPASQGHVVTRAVVAPFWQDRRFEDGTLLPEPRLGGRISLMPGQVFVPEPHSKLLQKLRRRDGEESPPEAPPRFAARISWGTRHEPWLESVRLIE